MVLRNGGRGLSGKIGGWPEKKSSKFRKPVVVGALAVRNRWLDREQAERGNLLGLD